MIIKQKKYTYLCNILNNFHFMAALTLPIESYVSILKDIGGILHKIAIRYVWIHFGITM